MQDPSIPILSHRPLARSFSDSALMTWNFSEELPQLITKIFIFLSPFPIKLNPADAACCSIIYYTLNLKRDKNCPFF